MSGPKPKVEGDNGPTSATVRDNEGEADLETTLGELATEDPLGDQSSRPVVTRSGTTAV